MCVLSLQVSYNYILLTYKFVSVVLGIDIMYTYIYECINIYIKWCITGSFTSSQKARKVDNFTKENKKWLISRKEEKYWI